MPGLREKFPVHRIVSTRLRPSQGSARGCWLIGEPGRICTSTSYMVCSSDGVITLPAEPSAMVFLGACH